MPLTYVMYPCGAWCMFVCMSSQAEMLSSYAHVANLLDACGDEATAMINRLEADRPDTPITPITLRSLKRLHTPTARQMLLGNMPKKGGSLKCLEKAIATTEWLQWLDWHWMAAPSDFLHPSRKSDVHLKDSLSKGVPLHALKVNLGAWSWKPEAPVPRWDVLGKADLWGDVFYTALRRRLSTPPARWKTVDAPDQVVSLCPKRAGVLSTRQHCYACRNGELRTLPDREKCVYNRDWTGGDRPLSFTSGFVCKKRTRVCFLDQFWYMSVRVHPCT